MLSSQPCSSLGGVCVDGAVRVLVLGGALREAAQIIVSPVGADMETGLEGSARKAPAESPLKNRSERATGIQAPETAPISLLRGEKRGLPKDRDERGNGVRASAQLRRAQGKGEAARL